MTEYIPISECKRGTIYRLHSRNLSYGVFVPEDGNGFIGIREKLGSRYLFTEYHYDNGPPFGTVRPLEVVGSVDDDRILLTTSLATVCGYCGERAEYVKVEGGVKKGDQTYVGEWRHITGDGLQCKEPFAISPMNRQLFQLLEKFEDQDS